MYMEGSSKAILAVLLAILLAACLAFWPQAKFVARLLTDLIYMNARDGWHSLVTYLQLFWQQHNSFSN